ncbi:MAG: SpoIID/LytB domain-containing protein [Coleofasciculaceae cyanobacterium]
MVRLTDRHPIFNRSLLWSISLFSTALFIPLVFAQSLLTRAEAEKFASKPSQEESLRQTPQQFQIKPSIEGGENTQVVEPSLSSSPPDTSAVKNQPSSQKSVVEKSISSPSQSPSPRPIAKEKSEKSLANSQTSLTSNSTAQTKEISSPKTEKQQLSQTKTSTKNKIQVPDLSQNPPSVEIRVAIIKEVDSLVVAASTPTELVDGDGKVVGKLPETKGTNVLPNGTNLRIGNMQVATGIWLMPSKDGLVFVNNRWYRGDILLISEGSTLLAINYIDLESYLKSVVGAEIYEHWPMAALKAQAIAARSYALVHSLRPAHALYDLGNTQRWQVYKGVESEGNRTSQAVQETTGVFLSHKGGIVESMYAASDSIVTNVFGGRGMSQNGAYKLSKQGYNYQEILANYYPGASLGWIENK